MRASKFGVLLAALFAAGCAATPEPAASVSEPASIPPITPNLIVDAADEPPAGSIIQCRDLLKHGSNVIIRQCMTADDWEIYDRREARDAQAMVRMLQGSGFR